MRKITLDKSKLDELKASELIGLAIEQNERYYYFDLDNPAIRPLIKATLAPQLDLQHQVSITPTDAKPCSECSKKRRKIR